MELYLYYSLCLHLVHRNNLSIHSRIYLFQLFKIYLATLLGVQTAKYLIYWSQHIKQIKYRIGKFVGGIFRCLLVFQRTPRTCVRRKNKLGAALFETSHTATQSLLQQVTICSACRESVTCDELARKL